MRARMTLLDIIKSENKASSSRKDLNTSTISDQTQIYNKQEVVTEVARRMK